MTDKNIIPQSRLIQSIQRGTSILELFIDHKKPLGITDFSKRLELPKTTIQGIVKTLEALKYLEKDPDSAKYRLGPKVFQLGITYASNMDMISVARVWMERLCFQFMVPVNVGILVGDRAIIVLRVEPENRFMTFPQAGTVIPFHSTSIGKILLATVNPDRRERILQDYSFESLTENSITSRENLITELEQVRKENISFDNEENFIGLAGIGGPIFNHTGQVVAAFAVTGDADKINNRRDEIISAVKYTSDQVSAQFGYSGNEV